MKEVKRSVKAHGVAADPKKKTGDQRSKVHEFGENKQHNLNKVHDHKSFAAKKPIVEKKQAAPPLNLSENPTSLAHEAVEIKKKPEICCKSTLELFEISKNSADVASAKGILLSTEETSICVDTLTLPIGFPISSTATETKRIMERPKHKDRKICNSASALLQHWSQSITDQQHRDALITQG